MIYLLHISDLHLSWDANCINMQRAILKNVKETLKDVPAADRLLVVTGDFHYYSQEGYDDAKRFLNILIQNMGLTPSNDVFLIPGNHDVSPCAKKDTHRKNALKVIMSEPKEFKENCGYLQSNCFYEEYLTLVKDLGVYDKTEVDKGLPIQTHVRTWNNRLHLLHLNTTLVADGNSKDNQFTDATTASSFAGERNLLPGDLPSLCLGHNSFSDINEQQRDQLAGAFCHGYVSARTG